MQLLENFRRFLFPFEPEVIETPKLIEKEPEYTYIRRHTTEEVREPSREFLVTDSFLYLNHL